MKKRPNSCDVKLDEIGTLICQGQHGAAKLLLRELISGRIVRKDATKIARLARRLRLAPLGIRLLHRFVRPQDRAALRRFGPPTPEEQLEYAACLIRLGAIAEGRHLLDELDETRQPAVALQRAFARICEWDYGAAIPHLDYFLKATPTTDYEHWVGRVNMGAALVASQSPLAEEFLASLWQTVLERGVPLLMANVLELTAQNHVHNGKYVEALATLDEAARLVANGDSLDAFFIKKWRCLARFREQASPTTLQEVDALREEAIRLRHWETVRSIDYEKARALRDTSLLLHLYFGTRYPVWRAKVREDYCFFIGRPDVCLPETYLRRLGKLDTDISEVIIDERTGVLDADNFILAGGKVPYRLFRTLNADFYRPMRTAEIFGELFPEEHFSPLTSANRVYQAVRRLNEVLEEADVPLTVEHDSGAYGLREMPGTSVGVICERRDGEAYAPRSFLSPQANQMLEKFKGVWNGPEFSARDFLEETQMPRRTGLRYLTRAVETGSLERLGHGPATRYRFIAGERRAPIVP
jgi:hypothetical protein